MLTPFLSIFYVIIGYLFGSICSAVIVCRVFSLPDPTTEGSKNPGATNVLRIAGKKYAIIVLVTDMLKGFLPVLLAHLLGANSTVLGFVCLASVLGHIYPVFFNFIGGKGVATALGALLGFNWILGGLVVLTWLVIALISRYSSLASIISIVLAPFYCFFLFHNLIACAPLALMTGLVIYKHRSNLSRLMNGTEPKIKLKKS